LAQAETSFPIGGSATLEELDLDPHPLLSRLREREPVSWLPALGGWLVARRDLALQAMGDSATFTVDDPRFSTGQIVGPSMLTLDGAAHGRHRDPFAPAPDAQWSRGRLHRADVKDGVQGIHCRTESGSRHCFKGRFKPGERVTDFSISLPDHLVTRVTVAIVID
jgi:hypothetical protein